ncbi:MAG: hypothetical protein V4501_11025 [Pseudomonadota bacterium]
MIYFIKIIPDKFINAFKLFCLILFLALLGSKAYADVLTKAVTTASINAGITAANKQYTECGGFFVWISSESSNSGCDSTNCGGTSNYHVIPFSWMPFSKDQASATTQPATATGTVTSKQLCNGGTYTISALWNIANQNGGRWQSIQGMYFLGTAPSPTAAGGTQHGASLMNTIDDNANESSTANVRTQFTVPATGNYYLSLQTWNQDCSHDECNYWVSAIGYVLYDGLGTPY